MSEGGVQEPTSDHVTVFVSCTCKRVSFTIRTCGRLLFLSHLDNLGSGIAIILAFYNSRVSTAGSPPGRPENVTVKRISPSTVVLTWLSNAEENARYEISYKPVKASYKTVTEVDARQKSIVLDRLLPTALYQVHITTINDEGRSNQSQTIIFDTSQNSANGTTKSSQGLNGTLNARGEEIGIVVVVLLLWVFVILLFFNKWGKIRMLEPYHPEYKQAHVIPTCQLKGSRITLDQMHVSMNALFERERLLSVAHVHRAARPRQNSVFVHGSINATTSAHSFSRKVKSAEDIQSMIFKSAENVASTEM